MADKSQDCNVRMLVRDGHAGFIIGKGGARVKELRMVVIVIFLHCPFCASFFDVQQK